MAKQDIKKKRRGIRELPLTRLIPNMLTMLALFCGLSAVRFAMEGSFEIAALAIVVAGVLDILDGRVARMLGASSKFGAELDSLADLTSFGVAPGLVLFIWALADGGNFGWGASLVFAACSALRLARFNTMLEDEDAPKWTKGFFTGVPAPAGAGLALLPMFVVLAFGETYMPSPIVLSIWMLISGGLMVSRVPTLAMKGRKVSPAYVAPIMAGVCLLVAALFTNTWETLATASAVYVLSIPCGWLVYNRRAKIEKNKEL